MIYNTAFYFYGDYINNKINQKQEEMGLLWLYLLIIYRDNKILLNLYQKYGMLPLLSTIKFKYPLGETKLYDSENPEIFIDYLVRASDTSCTIDYNPANNVSTGETEGTCNLSS